MFVVIWEYTVRPEGLREFERVYGADGEWAAMFGRCEGFVETELLRDTEQPDRFVTIDYWRLPDHYVGGLASLGDAYRSLDERCAAFMVTERHVGNFVKR
jgi:heme-degrading monooxygenase HmoA